MEQNQSHSGSISAQEVTFEFKREILDFQMYMLHNRAKLPWWGGEGAGDSMGPSLAQVDLTMRMIEAIASHAAKLSDRGCDIDKVSEELREVRVKLEASVRERDEAAAAKFQLPTADVLEKSLESVRAPLLLYPALNTTPEVESDIDAFRKQALANLGMHVLDPHSPDCSTMKVWLVVHRGRVEGTAEAQIVLQTVERWLFGLAGGLRSDAVLPADDVSKLEEIVELYRTHVRAFLKSPSAAVRMAVAVLSKETLVVWVAYALTDQAVRHQHPHLMGAFGTSLDYQDLQHLVLEDKLSTDTALTVGKYLNSTNHPPVFSLRGNDMTNALATVHSKQDDGVMKIWAVEQAAAASRREYFWEEIQRKKALYKRLYVELIDLKMDLERTRRDVTDGEARVSYIKLAYSSETTESRRHGVTVYEYETRDDYKTACRDTRSAISDQGIAAKLEEKNRDMRRKTEIWSWRIFHPLPSSSRYRRMSRRPSRRCSVCTCRPTSAPCRG